MRRILIYLALLSIAGTGQAKSDDFDAILVCHGQRTSADGLSRALRLKFWYDRDTAKVIGCGSKGCITYNNVTWQNGWIVLHKFPVDFPAQQETDEIRTLSFSERKYHEVGYYKKKYYENAIRYESNLNCEMTPENAIHQFVPRKE